MKALLYSISIVPPAIDETFGGNGFFNFGRLAFVYPASSPVLYQGPTHWIEAKNGIIFPERNDPIEFQIYLKPGVIFMWKGDYGTTIEGIGATIGGRAATALGNKLGPLH